MLSSNYFNSHNLNDVNSLALSGSQTRSRILNNDQLFSKSKGKHLVELTQLDPDISENPRIFAFSDASQLSEHFRSRERNLLHRSHVMEIYTIHQQDTWSPLNVSQSMISTLMDYHNLSSGFLHILACFRARYLPTEESFSGAFRSIFEANQSECGWVYKYCEKKEVKRGNPWRIRHTGIYHVHDYKRGRSTLIIVNPSPTAHFALYMQDILQQSQIRSRIIANPILIHTMLISCHLNSWREYLEHHETLLLKLDMQSACTVLEEPLVSFDTLKEVRDIEKQILPLEPIMKSLGEVVHGLQEENKRLPNPNDDNQVLCLSIQATLEQFQREAVSYKNQALYIHRRAQLTAQSISDSLSLGFQQLAQSQSTNTMSMAKSAREDSVAIRAITLVTSFYMPFSFVATMFGMNLLDFDSGSRNILVSNQFWLYFVISVPLTVATLACWRWRMRTYREEYMVGRTRRSTVNRSAKNTSDIEMV